jgi:hypothetical protein
MADRLWNIIPTGFDHETGEVLRDAGSMQHELPRLFLPAQL